MNILAKLVHFILSHFPSKIKNILRSILPLSVKRALGKSVMEDAVTKDSVVTVLDGRKFKTIEDRLFLRVYFEKNYEPLLSAIANSLIEKNDNVVDVGANFGWYTTLFSKLAKPGKVVCYEPAPHSYKILDENIQLNNMESDISVRKVGVGANPGSFLMEPGSSSESGLAHVVKNKASSTIEVPVVKLDTDLIDIIGNISYIKFDIEGFEFEALKGAKELLSAQNQPIIQIELNEEALVRAGSSRKETITFLEDLGYSFYEAIPDELGTLRVSDTNNCSDMFCFGRGEFSKRLEKLLAS